MPDSLQVQIEDAVVTTLRALSLSGVASENIARQLVPLDRDPAPTALPAIRVGPGGSEKLDPKHGTNLADDIGYPVLVVLLDRANQDLTAATYGDQWLRWREQVVQAFHHKRLSGVSAVFECVVEPREIVTPSAWLQQNLFASGLVVWCRARRSRA